MPDNQFRYGITYGIDGRITGFALSPDKWVALTDDEIFEALEKVAKRNARHDKGGVEKMMRSLDSLRPWLMEVSRIYGVKVTLNIENEIAFITFADGEYTRTKAWSAAYLKESRTATKLLILDEVRKFILFREIVRSGDEQEGK